jgi:hypothetical protein
MIGTRRGVPLGLMLSFGLFATAAHAQINVNVHIGEPPPVVVYSPPTMVLMPEPQMYVAVGVPYDIFSSAGATIIFMAGIGSGDRDTADHGPSWRWKHYLRAPKVQTETAA